MFTKKAVRIALAVDVSPDPAGVADVRSESLTAVRISTRCCDAKQEMPPVVGTDRKLEKAGSLDVPRW